MNVAEAFKFRIEIPGPPKGVGRAKHGTGQTKDGRRFSTTYTPAATRTEAGVIRMYAEKEMAGRPLLQREVKLTIYMFMAIPKSMTKRDRVLATAKPSLKRPTVKPDTDNCSKFTDQLKGVVWRDDAQVTDQHIFKRYSDRPRVIIEVTEAIPLELIEDFRK